MNQYLLIRRVLFIALMLFPILARSFSQTIPNKDIQFIEQDDKGWTWMVHDEGVDKFDGDSISTIPFSELKPENLTSFYCQERKFIAAENGLFEVGDTSIELVDTSLKNILHTNFVDNLYYFFSKDSLFYGNLDQTLTSSHLGTASIDKKILVLFENANLLNLAKKYFLLDTILPIQQIQLKKHFNPINIRILDLDAENANNPIRVRVNTSDYTLFPNQQFVLTDEMINSGENQLSFEYKDKIWKEVGVIFIHKASYSREELISVLAILGLLLFLSLLSLTLSYYRRIAAYRKSELAIKEIENTTQQKVIELVQDENTNLEKLSNIQKAINEIARQESTKDLIQLALKHIIEEFGYDLAIISQVDYFNRKIISTGIASVFLDSSQEESWLRTAHYSLDEEADQKDILNHIIKEKRTIKAVGKYILDNDIVQKGGQLNSKVLDIYDRIKLSSLFIPIIHRTLKESNRIETTISTDLEEGDIVLGVIEVAKKLDNLPTENDAREALELDASSKRLERDRIQLELYVDNFAQPYYRSYEREKTEELINIIPTKLDAVYEDHAAYIDEILLQTARFIKADFANIAFQSFNHAIISINREGHFYNYEKNELEMERRRYAKENADKPTVTHHVSVTKKPYLVNDLSNDLYYVRVKGSILSEIGIPLFDEYGVVIGVAVFSSNKENFFNKLHIRTLSATLLRATDIYLKKKRYNALGELTKPYDIFSQKPTDIYKYACQSLDQYFQIDNIAIWKRVSSSKPKFELLDTYKKELRKELEEKNYTTFDLPLDFDDVRFQAPKNRFFENLKPSGNEKFYEFCKKNKFQSWLLLPIVIESKVDAFIYAFSKRKIVDNPYNIKFTTQIAQKTALAIQGINLAKSINEISKSLSDREGETTVKIIVKKAFELLRADSIALFKKRPEDDKLRMRDVIFEGKTLERHEINLNKEANMANWILANKQSVYFSKEQEYNEFFDTHLQLTTENHRSFWKEHELGSVAAIYLEQEDEPLGVMFFNLTTRKNFKNKEERRIIESFTNLANIALKNEDYINKVQEERAALKQEEEQARIELEKIGREKKSLEIVYEETYKKYEEAHQRMEELIPKATRTSFWIILQGINHDIRNFLLKMQIGLIELKKYTLDLPKGEKVFLENILSDIRININSITNLLALFRFREVEVQESINIAATIDEVCQFFTYRNFGITIDFEVKGIPRNHTLRKTEFSMVIYNLINNAVEAIRQMGTRHIGKIKVIINYQAKDSKIEIIDNGIGIDNSLHERIFELGFSTNSSGLGIGLYFVKEMIEVELNGKIEVRSGKGLGTTFTIKLPA